MLCDLWSRGQFGVLWRLTQCRSNLAPSTKNFDRSLHPRLESFPKLTAAGPSGMRVQHLLDAASVPLPTPISTSLRHIINVLAAGKAPQELAIFLSGASLTALSKNKPNGPSDIRPIAVGEVLRRITSKCLCHLIRVKAADFFQPLQLGVTCPQGVEIIVHHLRSCIKDHCSDKDIVVLKVDMTNAFNLVSRQAVLDNCAQHFSEFLAWTSWCYSQHPLLWHQLGILTSQVGVQQGDPLGPFLFALVLQRIVNMITLMKNVLMCHTMLELLGAPIGDSEYCNQFISRKHQAALALLSTLEEIGSLDPQVALALLCLCSGFCKLIHIARVTPPHLILDAMQRYDADIRCSFANCTGVDASDTAWKQAKMSLRRGGLGLRSLADHSSAAYIASFCTSGCNSLDPLGHHCVTCKRGGNVTLRHNALSNVLFNTSRRAGLSSHLEVGSGWGQESSRTRPADILVTNWDNGISAAFDVTVASPLNSSTITEVGMYSGAAARAAELRKHTQNDSKWAEISCKCIPLAVECYGAWGPEALKAFSQVATRLAIRGNTSKSMALTDLFGRLSHSLIRANARAILSRSYSHLMQQGLLLEITFPVPATIPSILRYKSFSPFKLEEERFDEDHLIPAFGFGDIKTKDKSVFPLKPDGPCLGFEQVLKCYTSVAKEIQLSGPTNFAPLVRIKKAIEIVKKEQSVSCMCDLGDVTLPLPQYHILVIIADGQVTNEVPTRVAIVEASKYPLSIVVVGVGDGPWDQMDEFGELAERAFDNFQFVDYNKFAAAKDPDIDFAVRALMEIPDQFLAVRKLGLL
ncbi:hypothetical protein EMCRGX_G022577 [Ephydatia muelleri]